MRDDVTTRPIPLWAFAAAGFVLLAVALELMGSAWANSPAPSWAHVLVPLAWPAPARVVWWLLVASAAGAFHVGVARSDHDGRPVIGWLTVALFVTFAIGIALGAEWATWH